MIWAWALLLAGYLFGSIPTGYWLVKALKGQDIRQMGSGSTGATNVARAAGNAAGIAVFFIDVLKGYIPVRVAVMIDDGSIASLAGIGQEWNAHLYPHLVPCLVAIIALLGHSRSIFLRFTGGKSAATGLGTLFALNAVGGFCTFILFVTVMKTTATVSIASIAASATCPIFFALAHAPLAFIGYCAAGGLFIIIRHRSNIKRLLKGTEPKIGQKPAGETLEDTNKTTAESPAKGSPEHAAKGSTESPGQGSAESPSQENKNAAQQESAQ